jgi:gamma-D-glutamyl-L-lysine dipeptidyl-peptidase
MLSLLVASFLTFSYVQVPVVTMRETPYEFSKAVSQAIFAEEVVVLERDAEWTKIETKEDGCAGWISSDAIVDRDIAYADCSCITPLVEVTSFAAPVYDRQDTSSGAIFILPFECRLEAVDPFNEPDCSWITLNLPDGKQGYIQRGDVTCEMYAIAKQELAEFSKQFVHLPFTSGGRSSFGYDSSGFVQMLYRHIGLTIPRRIQDQCDWEGFEKTSLDQCESGDLIFWGRSASEIHHVGMYLGGKRFIHITTKENQPWVRISDLDTPLYNGEGEWPFRTMRRVK